MNEKAIMDTLDKDLEASLAEIKANSQPSRPLQAPPQAPSQRVNREVSLSDQFAKMETVHQRLKEQVRYEKMILLAEHDKRWTEIQHEFARKIHDEVVKLERARDAALRQLTDDYHEKTREIEYVASRLSS